MWKTLACAVVGALVLPPAITLGIAYAVWVAKAMIKLAGGSIS